MADLPFTITARAAGATFIRFIASVEWTGTASDLLTELGKIVGEAARNRQDWPKSGRGLSGVLRRLAPNLRAVGIDVQFDTDGRGNNKRRIFVPPRPSPDTPHLDHDNPDGTDGDGHSHECSNLDDDESDRREREAIMAVEAEADAVATLAHGGAFTA